MMDSANETLERIAHRIPIPEPALERMLRRRDRQRRNHRIAAGAVGIAVFVASLWFVRDVVVFDQTDTSVVPAVTGPTRSYREPPKTAVGPVPESDYLIDLNTGEMTPLPESIAGEGYAASPDGSMLAYTERGDNGKDEVFVANLDWTQIEQVTHGLEGASSPVWSPDGSKIAYSGYHDGDLRDLFVLDLATGESMQLSFSALEPDLAGPDFSPWRSSPAGFTPDGSSIVYFASRDNINRGQGEIRMVPVAGGDSVLLRKAADGAALSPDGSLLVYVCDDALGSTCVANADGTDEREADRFLGDVLDNGDWSPDGARIAFSLFPTYDVMVADLTTGQETHVAEGSRPTWLDDHTLIIEMDRCYDHTTGRHAIECPR